VQRAEAWWDRHLGVDKGHMRGQRPWRCIPCSACPLHGKIARCRMRCQRGVESLSGRQEGERECEGPRQHNWRGVGHNQVVRAVPLSQMLPFSRSPCSGGCLYKRSTGRGIHYIHLMWNFPCLGLHTLKKLLFPLGFSSPVVKMGLGGLETLFTTGTRNNPVFPWKGNGGQKKGAEIQKDATVEHF
jgi:hypothetical protein